MNGMNMNNNTMFSLENKLSGLLKPVRPDPVFVNSLKTKLVHTPSIIMETSKKRIGLLVVGISLLTGALAVWGISLITRIKKIKQ